MIDTAWSKFWIWFQIYSHRGDVKDQNAWNDEPCSGKIISNAFQAYKIHPCTTQDVLSKHMHDLYSSASASEELQVLEGVYAHMLGIAGVEVFHCIYRLVCLHASSLLAHATFTCILFLLIYYSHFMLELYLFCIVGSSSLIWLHMVSTMHVSFNEHIIIGCRLLVYPRLKLIYCTDYMVLSW